MKSHIYEALMDWNPWLESEFPKELLGFTRDYYLLDYLKVPEIKIIEGARRVGKSTLIYQIIYSILKNKKKILYVNFEDEVLKNYTLAEIVYCYQEQTSIDYLFVDEIQNCQDWVSFIRKTHDRKEIQQIWISGSNSTFIKKEYATLLTGRNLSIFIYPLSFHEFLNFNSVEISKFSSHKKQKIICKKLFSEYMEHGSFPAVVNRTVLKKELLLSYFNDFIYKDIVSRYKVDSEKIKELAIYLATNSTKQFSYRNLSKFLNCHINTITDYIGHLKSVFLFDELYKFDYSLKKQIANDKKIYCIDSGLAAAVSFRFSEEKGRMLENLIYNELKRRKHNIFFHKQKYECDFIIKKELKITDAIQVCTTLNDRETKNREIAGLIDALKSYQLHQGLILTYDEEGEEIIEIDDRVYTIKIKPAWEWLLE